MDITLIILNVLVLLGMAALSVIGKNYFSNYVSEKAKNLASKEDIAQITEQIENVKSSYAHSLEKAKSELQVKSALQQAFQSKCLEAVVAINDLLVEIHLYCWKEICERSENEHYVWRHVNESKEDRGFHYFRVAIDKVSMTHGLYLTQQARHALSELSQQIGLLSSMELALTGDPTDPVDQSASSGYETGIKAVKKCRESLMSELGINNES
ncbi:hypothetical protein KVP08_004785 [Shewanella putrefaciens]|nr:hypothetical protein KVP08_004785 [Shewanella putrefaciens]